MSGLAIRAEGLGKQYRLGGAQERYRALRDTLAELALRPVRMFRPATGNALRRGDDTLFWALKDASFEVRRGEVIGVIGRNGAGKSTLLKILSRITEPTTGWVDIAGRVASLLEVGTGFHPELTGRENTYLNGAILGMTRGEIAKKFDEIIAFAEVERFIDTPVKHYSSGMYLRLAFAVAAHLEPEILLVDEVLAVGDAAFQRKCLGKMDAVARGGRTVLFVSHNLGAIHNLCSSALLLEDGKIQTWGRPAEVIDEYLAQAFHFTNDLTTIIPADADREGDGRVRITAFTAVSVIDQSIAPPRTGAPLRLELDYIGCSQMPIRTLRVAITIRDSCGQVITTMGNRYSGDELAALPAQGTIICEVPLLPLMPGRYTVSLVARANDGVSDKVRDAASFSVQESGRFGRHALPDAAHAKVLFDYQIRAGEPSTERCEDRRSRGDARPCLHQPTS